MNCLFVGKFHDQSTNISQQQALERQGVEVDRFELARPDGAEMNLNLATQGPHYDFVLISKGHKIDPLVCQSVADQGTVVVVWYMDPLNSNWNQQMIGRVKV